MNTTCNGAELFRLVRSVDPSNVDLKYDKRFIARSAGRLLEETVELALACGLPSCEVFSHVADALHSEALKAGVYPSRLDVKSNDYQTAAIREELVDVQLLHEYLEFLTGATVTESDKREKILKLASLVRDGKMKIIDGLMYRKVSGR